MTGKITVILILLLSIAALAFRWWYGSRKAHPKIAMEVTQQLVSNSMSYRDFKVSSGLQELPNEKALGHLKWLDDGLSDEQEMTNTLQILVSALELGNFGKLGERQSFLNMGQVDTVQVRDRMVYVHLNGDRCQNDSLAIEKMFAAVWVLKEFSYLPMKEMLLNELNKRHTKIGDVAYSHSLNVLELSKQWQMMIQLDWYSQSKTEIYFQTLRSTVPDSQLVRDAIQNFRQSFLMVAKK